MFLIRSLLLGVVAFSSAVNTHESASAFLQTGVSTVHHFDIPLTVSHVEEKKRSALLQNLKARFRDNTVFVTVGDEPLRQQMLSEKHLATYYGVIKIRNSEFKVLFDTGSCEFWVPSDQCNTERCNAHRRYPTGQESFRLADNPDLNIQYLSGRVAGDMVLESVQVEHVTVPNQPVGLARVVDIDLLDDVVWDGILGLAFPNPNLMRQGITPLFDNIIQHHLLEKKRLVNQFAYYIDDERGALTLGGANCKYLGVPPQQCAQKFRFSPVVEQTYWTLRFEDVFATMPDGSVRGGWCRDQGGCSAIVDTGTYLIYGPEEQVMGMVGETEASCLSVDRLPSLTFVVYAGQDQDPFELTLHPRDYMLKFSVNGQDDCVQGVSPDRDHIWTLGQVFLRSFYTLFDRDQNRVGFARLPAHKHFHAINGHHLGQPRFSLYPDSS